MADKKYVCAYKHCLHHGEKVSSLESVVINKRHYHWDCAERKQKIQECAELYMANVEDKKQYPIVLRTINTLVFKYKVPIDYMIKQISNSPAYYKNKPVHALYGLRTLFWTKEFTV